MSNQADTATSCTSRDVTVVEKIYSNSHGIEITTMNNEYETYDHFISGGSVLTITAISV
jgi:hypothetical protein